MSEGEPGDGTPTARLASFGEALRQAGLAATPGHLVDAGRCLAAVDLADPADVFHALSAVYVRRPEDRAPFARVFGVYWGLVPPEASEDLPAGGGGRGAVGEARESLIAPEGTGDETERGRETVAGRRSPRAAGSEERLRGRDFTGFDEEELEAARRLLARLVPKLATRPSRRYRADPRGSAVDLRRTLRAGVARGGEALRPARRRRRLRRLKLVLLCDVSGSMDPYSRFLIEFLYGLGRRRTGVETFVFGMRLHHVTAYLRGKSVAEGLDAVARQVRDWGGGTDIGGSLRTFNRAHARAALGSKTVVIVVSDGWERGDPARLADEMRALKAHAHRVIWLNPLLANPGYAPLTRGMQAALPYIDHFLPAHNLESLIALSRTLRAA
jgi:uncharacterized protein with von Willebrand factor type A (vWA) domain